MNLQETLQAVKTATADAERTLQDALRAATAAAAAIAAAADPALDAAAQVARAASDAAATVADAAARTLAQAARTLAQAAADVPADAAQALKDAAAAAARAAAAAAAAAVAAVQAAAGVGIPGGAPVVGLGGESGGGGASGTWQPQIRRQDRRLPSNYWAQDILQRQFFWRITWGGQTDSYALPSWRVRTQWAWASLDSVSRLIERPCANFTEVWDCDLASAFERWSEDRAGWLATDNQMDVWRSELQDYDGIPAQDSPAWQEAAAKYDYVERVAVVAAGVPVFRDDCTVDHTTDVQRATPPADRLMQRGAPAVTHWTWAPNPLWGTMEEGWYVQMPKKARIFWFFPPIPIDFSKLAALAPLVGFGNVTPVFLGVQGIFISTREEENTL